MTPIPWVSPANEAGTPNAFPTGMYLRDALSHCRDLEEEISRMYDELASQHERTPTLASTWHALAADERSHSRQLAALLAIHDALDDDGPFLVGFDARVNGCAKLVRDCYTRVHEGIAPADAVPLCAALERSEFDHLFAEMRDLARPALKRFGNRLSKTGSCSSHSERIEALERTVSESQATSLRSAAEHPDTGRTP